MILPAIISVFCLQVPADSLMQQFDAELQAKGRWNVRRQWLLQQPVSTHRTLELAYSAWESGNEVACRDTLMRIDAQTPIPEAWLPFFWIQTKPFPKRKPQFVPKEFRYGIAVRYDDTLARMPSAAWQESVQAHQAWNRLKHKNGFSAGALSLLPGLGKAYLGDGPAAWKSLGNVAFWTAIAWESVRVRGMQDVVSAASIGLSGFYYLGGAYSSALGMHKMKRERRLWLEQSIRRAWMQDMVASAPRDTQILQNAPKKAHWGDQELDYCYRIYLAKDTLKAQQLRMEALSRALQQYDFEWFDAEYRELRKMALADSFQCAIMGMVRYRNLAVHDGSVLHLAGLGWQCSGDTAVQGLMAMEALELGNYVAVAHAILTLKPEWNDTIQKWLQMPDEPAWKQAGWLPGADWKSGHRFRALLRSGIYGSPWAMLGLGLGMQQPISGVLLGAGAARQIYWRDKDARAEVHKKHRQELRDAKYLAGLQFLKKAYGNYSIWSVPIR